MVYITNWWEIVLACTAVIKVCNKTTRLRYMLTLISETSYDKKKVNDGFKVADDDRMRLRG